MMGQGIRKFALTAHIALSVGWIGAALAYLVLVLVAMAALSDLTLRAVWISLNVIGWYVLVPLAAGAVITGVMMALGTPWGLFRYYWVLMSLLLTIVASVVMVQHMFTVSAVARLAVDVGGAGLTPLREALPGELLHAGAGLLLLLAIALLNVYKPRGLTPYGHRRRHTASVSSAARASPSPVSTGPAMTPRWVQVVWAHALVIGLVLAIAHVISRGLQHH